MRRTFTCLLLSFIFYTKLYAQTTELQLAQQYTITNQPEKAIDIYQKLFKQDNDAYYQIYVNALISLKKFPEAESITKKMMRKHPEDVNYPIVMGNIYTQKGDVDRANDIYNGIIKNLPNDQNQIAAISAELYQNNNLEGAIKVLLQGRKLLKNDELFKFELINLYRYSKNKEGLTNEYLNFLPANPGYINQVENTLSTMYDGGNEDYDALKELLIRRIQKDPQQIIYADMLTWDYLQEKEFDQALNQALASSRRTRDDGNSIFALCRTLVVNQAYDVAIRGYQYLVNKGRDNPLYIPAKVEMINTKGLVITSGKYTQADLLNLEKDYTDLLIEFGKNGNTAYAMQKLAHLQAFKLHKLTDAQKLLESIPAITDISPELLASCKLDLGDVYLLNNHPWDATLLYSQVEKDYPNTNIGQDAKFRNAKLAYYTGDFTWAKGQLDVLKAATSQLIANDALNLSLLIKDNTVADSIGSALKVYARADLHIFAEEPDKALNTLDSIDKKFPGNSLTYDILMAKARISIQENNYLLAVTDLKKIVEGNATGLWADDAVFMLGDIYDNHLTNKLEAKNYYQQIITTYPGSLWIGEARKRFRLLRGDKPTGS